MLRVTPATLPESERASLESWLGFHRATLLPKCRGLNAAQPTTGGRPDAPEDRG